MIKTKAETTTTCVRARRTKARRVLVQRGVYINDRQVREKHVFHAIDRVNPRTIVKITPLQAQQVALDLPVAVADPLGL